MLVFLPECYRRNLCVARKKKMMNEMDNQVSYNEIDKKWNLYRVYNYHLSEVSKGNTQPGFVDYHEFLFDVLENELHKTPMNLHNRQLFISMVEILRQSMIAVMKKDCLMRGQITNNDEVLDDDE